MKIPPLGVVCPAWKAKGFLEWGTPIEGKGARAPRTLGELRAYDRGPRGTLKRALVIGSAAPARPSLTELAKQSRALCEPSVLFQGPAGPFAVRSQRVRELNRTPRPLEAGLSVPVADAERIVLEAREALAREDVEASDEARAGALPYPHRRGSTPCTGPLRPAQQLRDLRAWREGEGFESSTERDVLTRLRAMIPRALPSVRVERLSDAPAAALAVESWCVGQWARWVERNGGSRDAAFRELRARVRKIYAPPKKADAKPRRAPRRRGLATFRPG